MALAGYVNERPILGCRVRALNDRLWVLTAPHTSDRGSRSRPVGRLASSN